MKSVLGTLALAIGIATPHGAVHAQGFFSETVEVRVTNVEAIVTDRAGRPVPGLTRDDFEIYEDGLRQEISNFAEIRETVPSITTAPAPPETPSGAAAPATPDRRRRHITVFIDNASLDHANRNAVAAQLRRFLHANVGPGDTAMLWVWSSGLRAELEPTGDHARIDSALDRIEKHTARSGPDPRALFEQEITDLISIYKGREPPELPPIDRALAVANSYGMRGTAEIQQKAEALESVITAQRGLDSRKILVFLTESLSANPAEEAFLYLQSIHDQFVGGGGMNATAEARLFELTDLAANIAAAANSSGVTLYPIHAAGQRADLTPYDASRHVRIGMLGVMTPRSSTPTLQKIAADTGGVALTGSSNWALAFDSIANDLGTWYSLGYRNRGERQDRVKKVEVRLKNRRYMVRTRNTVVEQTASTEMSDAVASNLFRPAPQNELGVRASFDPATTAGDNVTVVVTIPTQSLTLLPEGTELAGNFSVFAAFLRQDGAVSRVAQQNHRFRFPAESLSRRKELTVKLEVTADIRTGAMSIGVLDETSRSTGFALVSLIR